MLSSIFLALAIVDCSGGTCAAPTGIKVDINANVKVEKSKPKKKCGALCKVGRAVFGKRK